MAKFVSPLQRFWRSTISYANFSKSFSTTASANAYRAAFCTKLGKPLEIKNVTENKPLGKNEVDYYYLN